MRAVIVVAAVLVPSVLAAQGVRDCRIRSDSIEFGVYDPLETSREQVIGQVEVLCPRVVVSGIKVTLSTGDSGNYVDRTMLSGPSALHYNLFVDVTHLRLAGDGSNGTLPLAARASRSPADTVYNYYGFIPSGQNVPPGEYSDNIEVEVEF